MRRDLTTLIAATLLAIAGCKEHPTSDPPSSDPVLPAGKNLLVNSEFDCVGVPYYNNLNETYAKPWLPETATPQIRPSPNATDTLNGVMAMWGSDNNGESIYQALRTPIKKGHRYLVNTRVRWEEQDPLNFHRYVHLRFVASNAVGSYAYQISNISPAALIGVVVTADSAWKNLSTPIWTADADYTYFTMAVANDKCECDNPHNHSWAFIDNVELIELD